MATNYFEELFASSIPTGVDEVLREIPTKITAQMNEALVVEATGEEISKALFMMHPEKAPDPDGIIALFSKDHGLSH